MEFVLPMVEPSFLLFSLPDLSYFLVPSFVLVQLVPRTSWPAPLFSKYVGGSFTTEKLAQYASNKAFLDVDRSDEVREIL